MINNRIDDKMVIFNKQWNANHNKQMEKEISNRKSFINKIYGIDKNRPQNSYMTPSQKANNLQNKMNNSFNGYNTANRNNIVGNNK